MFTLLSGKYIMTASRVASFLNFDTFSKLKSKGALLLCYAMLISVQKLTQEIKPNTACLREY